MSRVFQMPAVNERQFHTIIAALRFYQLRGLRVALPLVYDIASNLGQVASLESEGIDDLVELLNFKSEERED